MENPVAEIPLLIETLCTAPPDIQRLAIETYFTPTASFTHPFCRTGSFAGSIWLIIMIYRWYKILSPPIDVAIDGIAFDEQNLRLYVSVRQNFKIWLVPFYNAPVKLVTVLQLTTTNPAPPSSEHSLLEPSESPTANEADAGKGKNGDDANLADQEVLIDVHGDESVRYWIQSQNDLYQTTEWIKFLLPWGTGVFLLIIWQFFSTFLCVAGAKGYELVTWMPRKFFPQLFNNGTYENGTNGHGNEKYSLQNMMRRSSSD